MVEPDRPQMSIWRMRIAYCIPKATNTHTLGICLIIIALPLQQQLDEHVSLLRHTYITWLAAFHPGCFQKSQSKEGIVWPATNSMKQRHSWKLIIGQTVRKFASFYGSQMFITVLTTGTTTPQPAPDKCISHSPNPSEIHFNIIATSFRSTPNSLSFSFSDRNFVHVS